MRGVEADVVTGAALHDAGPRIRPGPDEGAGAGESSLLGLRIARERGWTVPEEEGQ